MQDESTITEPRLLYYTQGMLTTILNNIYTPIGLVNGARYQAINIVPNENNMSNFWKVYNLANNYSNLLSNGFKQYFM